MWYEKKLGYQSERLGFYTVSLLSFQYQKEWWFTTVLTKVFGNLSSAWKLWAEFSGVGDTHWPWIPSNYLVTSQNIFLTPNTRIVNQPYVFWTPSLPLWSNTSAFSDNGTTSATQSLTASRLKRRGIKKAEVDMIRKQNLSPQGKHSQRIENCFRCLFWIRRRHLLLRWSISGLHTKVSLSQPLM